MNTNTQTPDQEAPPATEEQEEVAPPVAEEEVESPLPEEEIKEPVPEKWIPEYHAPGEETWPEVGEPEETTPEDAKPEAPVPLPDDAPELPVLCETYTDWWECPADQEFYELDTSVDDRVYPEDFPEEIEEVELVLPPAHDDVMITSLPHTGPDAQLAVTGGTAGTGVVLIGLLLCVIGGWIGINAIIKKRAQRTK